MLIFWLISLSVWNTFSIAISPFSYTLYQPANMYRATYSATLSMTSSPSTFSVSYPASPWSQPPSILYSVTALTFSSNLAYQVTPTSTGLTSMTIQLTFSSLSKISLCFLLLDSTLYPVTLSLFTYSMPAGTSTPQSFVVTGNQNHAGSFLIGLTLALGPFPSGYAPSVESEVVAALANIVTTTLTISYDPQQVAVQKMVVLFVDINLAAFTALPYAGSGQQFAAYGTSGPANDPYMASTYLSMYSRNYFFGLLVLYDGQFLLGGLSFDGVDALATNLYYLNCELLFASYYCPSSFPITDSTRTYCYSGCPTTHYYDSQYICQPCNSNCLTCSLLPTNCTSCQTPWVLIYGYVCGCSEDGYQVTASNGTITCHLCSTAIAGCQSCSSATHFQTAPTVCGCAAGTTSTQIGTEVYCVEGGELMKENCINGYQQQGQTCLCSSNLNFTLVNGTCS